MVSDGISDDASPPLVFQRFLNNFANTSSVAFLPPRCDRILATDATAINDASACSGEGRVDVYGSGFGFVHCTSLLRMADFDCPWKRGSDF